MSVTQQCARNEDSSKHHHMQLRVVKQVFFVSFFFFGKSLFDNRLVKYKKISIFSDKIQRNKS